MAEPNGRVKAALDYLNANLARFQEQLVTLSKIPGVSSADPAPAPVMRRSVVFSAGAYCAARPTSIEPNMACTGLFSGST